MTVESWIDDVASQTATCTPASTLQFYRKDNIYPATTAVTKRKRAAPTSSFGLHQSIRKSARLALRPISGNALAMAPVRTPAKSGQYVGRGRPPKRMRHTLHKVGLGDAQKEEEAEVEEEEDELADMDATPRVHQATTASPGLPSWRPSARRAPCSRPTKNDTTTSSRQSSPTKKAAAALQNSTQPIYQAPLTPDSSPPCGVAGLESLWDSMHDVAAGVGILPVEAIPVTRELDRSFKREAEAYDRTGTRAAVGHYPDPGFSKHMVQCSCECIEDSASEHAWNSFVHGPLLKQALLLSTRLSSVGVKDVSTCPIDPTSLLPNGAASEQIDYALVIRRTPALQSSLLLLDALDGASPSLNALADEALASCPIGVGIGAKRAGEGGEKADAQLSVWACATLNRMRRLQAQFGKAQTAVAELPLLLVQGATWLFRVATMDVSGAIYVWHHPTVLGTTTSVKGVCQVVAAVQILADWMENQWKPWYTANILP